MPILYFLKIFLSVHAYQRLHVFVPYPHIEERLVTNENAPWPSIWQFNLSDELKGNNSNTELCVTT